MRKYGFALGPGHPMRKKKRERKKYNHPYQFILSTATWTGMAPVWRIYLNFGSICNNCDRRNTIDHTQFAVRAFGGTLLEFGHLWFPVGNEAYDFANNIADSMAAGNSVIIY